MSPTAVANTAVAVFMLLTIAFAATVIEGENRRKAELAEWERRWAKRTVTPPTERIERVQP